MAGTKFDFTGVTYGEVFAGLLSQDYDDAALKSIDAFNYGAEITWNSTLLMTVTGLIKRSLQETTLDGGTASLVTQYRARVDHEIDRQILLNAELDFQTTDIEGVARKDDLYSIGIGAKYMLLRYLYLSGDYRYQRKISTADQGGFSRNQFMFRVEVQY